MLLSALVEVSERVAGTRSRNRKRSMLADLLRDLAADEAVLAVAYLSGSLPQGRIGVGFAQLRKMREVEPAPEPTLTTHAVDAVFTGIAEDGGSGSAGRRAAALEELFGAATNAEQAFLAGLLGGGLRQGALEGVMVEALAEATGSDPDAVRRAVMVSGDLTAVARNLVEKGPDALGRFRLRVMTPIQPMLAQTAGSVEIALEQLGFASFEAKLDGARIQVHRSGEAVRVFTRSLRDITASVPVIVAQVSAFEATDLILDGEALALRPDGRPEPFQDTMGRFGSDAGDEASDDGSDTALRGFFFDCVHRDGEDLLEHPYSQRMARLDEVVPSDQRVHRISTDSPAVAAQFLDEVLAAGHEGVMAKSLDDPYEAGRRGATWLKIKVAHTLDLVVLGVEWGSGRRTGWLSNLHLGARAESGEGFVMLGKTFKGLTDEMLEWQTARFLDLETRRTGHTVLVRPEQVVEIAFDGVQRSSRYPGGVALRFARVKRYRHDKQASEADTIASVRAILEGRRR